MKRCKSILLGLRLFSQKKLLEWVLWGSLLFLNGSLFSSSPGIIIEKIQPGFGLDNAGFQEGDTLLGWEGLGTSSRERQSGRFDTVWDWYWFRVEVAPRGKVKLLGKRGQQPISAELDPETIRKEQVRPNFSEALQASYLRGLKAIEEGDHQTGINAWDPLRNEATHSAWIALRSAEIWRTAKNWEQEKKYLAMAHAQANTLRAQLHLLMRRSNRLWNHRELDAAEEVAKAWYQLVVKQPESLALAKCLNLRGNLAWTRGAMDEAEKHHKRGLEIKFKKAPNSRSLADSFNNLGLIATNRGALEEAEAYHQSALKIRQLKVPGSLAEAASWQNLGQVAHERGNLKDAEQFLLKAAKICEKNEPQNNLLATVYSSLGSVAWEQGQLEKAEYFHRKSLELKREISTNSVDVAISLNNLGIVELTLGRQEEAEAHLLEALPIYEKVAPGSIWLADLLNNLGAIAWGHEDWFQAESYFQKVVAINRNTAPDSLALASSLVNLAGTHYNLRQLDRAQQNYEQALDLYQRHAPQSLEHGSTLSNLAILAGKRGQYHKALVLSERAYALIRSPGEAAQSGNRFQILEAGFRAHIALLAKQQQAEKAFQVTEEFRTLAMRRQLAERNILRDLIPEYQDQLKELGSQYDRLQNKLWQTEDIKEKERLQQELLGIRVRTDDIKQQIVANAPNLIEYGTPLGVAGVQQFVDKDALVLSYLFHDHEGLLFSITKEKGVQVYSLPISKPHLEEKIKLFQMAKGELETSRLRKIYQNLGQELFQTLLAPVRQELEQTSRLILVLDGPLWHLPFAALGEDKGGGFQYLIESKPITTVASATLYGLLKKQKKHDGFRVAAFGAPRYPDRLPSFSPNHAATDLATGRARLRPLPGTEAEVATITALFPETVSYLDSRATETHFKALKAHFNMVHVGSHAFFNPDTRHNQTGIYFSMPSEFREGEDNGILQYREIFELNLKMDLLVLSACQTALGVDGGGQGLLGLTRAFQYAGVRSIIASLWTVDDQATAQLMKNFYEHLHQGARADEALRLAQIDMIRGTQAKGFWSGIKRLFGKESPDYSSHHYWAPFQVIGPP